MMISTVANLCWQSKESEKNTLLPFRKPHWFFYHTRLVVHDWHRQVDLGRLFIHDWQAYCVWKNRGRVDQGRPGDFKRAQPLVRLLRRPFRNFLSRDQKRTSGWREMNGMLRKNDVWLHVSHRHAKTRRSWVFIFGKLLKDILMNNLTSFQRLSWCLG